MSVPNWARTSKMKWKLGSSNGLDIADRPTVPRGPGFRALDNDSCQRLFPKS